MESSNNKKKKKLDSFLGLYTIYVFIMYLLPLSFMHFQVKGSITVGATYPHYIEFAIRSLYDYDMNCTSVKLVVKHVSCLLGRILSL